MRDERPTHLDLFSGLGGFAIAAREAGFETIAFCESDDRCAAFLEKTWALPVERDVRQLNGRQYRGVSLLTGGPPCQPASRAGKQGGESDDRWLWGEALRVLAEAEPDSVVFENPPGILDVGIDGILSEMDRLGYEVQPFDIPACAVGSPQLRHRIWIVGFRKLADAEREQSGGNEPGRGSQERAADRRDGASYVAHSSEPGRERGNPERGPDGCGPEHRQTDLADTQSGGFRANRISSGQSGHTDQRGESDVADAERERRHVGREQSEEQPARDRRPGFTRDAWSQYRWTSCSDGKFRRTPDEPFDVVNGLHRSILAALGNSIVPQVAVEILRAVRALI